MSPESTIRYGLRRRDTNAWCCVEIDPGGLSLFWTVPAHRETWASEREARKFRSEIYAHRPHLSGMLEIVEIHD